MQTEQSKHQRKMDRGELGPTGEDLKKWLSRIDQLKPYVPQFEDAKITGSAMLEISSEEELSRCGVSINEEVDKYCLLLNLARVRVHTRESGVLRTSDKGKAKSMKPKRSKAKRPLAERGGALGSVEMEPTVQAGRTGTAQLGVC